MNLYSHVKNHFLSTKRLIKTNSLDSLLWLVNVVPNIAGFSIRKDKIWIPFWIFHLLLLIYVYGVGSFVYQWKYAQGVEDLIKSYVNVSLFILLANLSWWFIKKRQLLKSVLKDIDLNDRLSCRLDFFSTKHEKSMKMIKLIVLTFYGCNLIDAFFIYLPHRVDVLNSYAMAPCVGMEPLNVSPNREICLTILAVQEFTIMTVALNFQALLLLLIAHTAVMYQMLSHEMIYFNENRDVVDIKKLAKDTLPSLIRRHAITLLVIDKLKSLYSVPLGVNFGTNALCMSLFFCMPIQEWLQFMPIMIYCFLVFFLYCFLCQRLINASEDFERCVYCCGWENFDLKEMKLVYMMLCQAQKPVEILAADIIPVNIHTFATTLQGLYKFVTVMKI